MNAKFTPSECVADVLAGINEKRDATSRSLTLHYEASSEWLAEAIQTCKRKILEGTGHEISEPKRMKPMTESDQENVVESVGTGKDSVQVILKKEISAASVNKEVPASVKQEPAPKLDTNPGSLCVMSLKVADLRSELQQRGLDTTGLKKDLQNRLLKEVAGAESMPQESNNASKPAASSEKAEEVNDEGSDVEMKDAKNDNTDAKMDIYAESVPRWNESMADVTTTSISGKQATASDDQDKMPEQHLKVTIVGKSFLKSTAELFSPSKIASKFLSLKQDGAVSEPSPVVPVETKQNPDAIQPSRNADSFKKSASAILSASPVGKSKPVQANKSPFPKVKTAKAIIAAKHTVVVDLNKTKPSSAQLNQSESPSKPQSQEQTSKPVAPVPSKLNSAGTATKEKRDKATADRMARLAEMRGKSKPVAGSKSAAVNDPPALAASKRLPLNSATDSKSDRRVLLTAQMREKAAACMKLQQSSKAKVVVSQLKQAKAHETVARAVSQQEQAKAPENVAPVLSQQKEAKGQESEALFVSLQKMAKPQATAASVVKLAASPKAVDTKKLAASTPSAAPRSVSKTLASSAKKPAPRPDILSPMSTYEISDREQSDTDDSESESDQNKKKKKVPTWAQRSNLLPALELQYANRDGRLDPETIFPPVSSCNLEEIFDQKKTRYNRRTSSANWTKDGVTAIEIVAYKRTMGY